MVVQGSAAVSSDMLCSIISVFCVCVLVGAWATTTSQSPISLPSFFHSLFSLPSFYALSHFRTHTQTIKFVNISTMTKEEEEEEEEEEEKRKRGKERF